MSTKKNRSSIDSLLDEDDESAGPVTRSRARKSVLLQTASENDLDFGDTSDLWEEEHYSRHDLRKGSEISDAFKTVGSAIGQAARVSWRALRHGERMKLDSGYAEIQEPEKATYTAIGSTGSTLSDYVTKHNSESIAVGMAWYMREMHHDPQGFYKFMMSMFLVALSAGLFYQSFVQAFVLLVVLDFVQTLVWFVARASSPILAKNLDACESRSVALIYNVAAGGVGLLVAFFLRETWPGLLSVWQALENKGCGSSGYFLVWAPCTDAQTFVLQALLFIFIFTAAFRELWFISTVGFVLVGSFASLTHVTSDAANNIMLQAFSALYFWFWMQVPIRNSFIWNMLFALFTYLFIVSIAALSGSL